MSNNQSRKSMQLEELNDQLMEVATMCKWYQIVEENNDLSIANRACDALETCRQGFESIGETANRAHYLVRELVQVAYGAYGICTWDDRIILLRHVERECYVASDEISKLQCRLSKQ